MHTVARIAEPPRVRRESGLTERHASCGAKERLRLRTERASGSHAQGATLLVVLQLPRAVSSTRLPSGLFRAVLAVTLEGQDTKNPKRRLSVAVLSITVLPRPIDIPVSLPVT